jgi:putative transposase
MRYDPNIHHRRSIRLKGYDYSQKGVHFVTICIQQYACLLGTIKEGQMFPNMVGEMIQRWWLEVEHKFPDIEIEAYMVMPNHFHGIVYNLGMVNSNIGVDLGVCPCDRGEHVGSPLHRVVQWFKTMTTNEYIRNVKQHGWQRFDRRLWQRNYYEHII